MPLKDDKETENTVVKNEEIHENDVLMGRGGKNNRHVGNERLRDIARGQVEKYKVSTKKIKSAISRDIVKQVRSLDPEGRFLKRVPETGEWEDVGDYLAREKVAQVLRDAVCEAADAMRPSIHPAMYPTTGPPYMHYPDGRAAAGVFRQGPMPGMHPMAMDDDSRRPGGIPGVVTASGSSSFGHPSAYHMPPPWHPYGPPPHPQHPYPGMHQHHPPHPFPPGYHPPHPGQFVASSAYTAAYMPPGPPPRPPPTRTPPSEEPSTPSTQQPPTKSQGTSSAFGPAYSFSFSVAAGTTPVATGTEAHMWHPPAYVTTAAQGKRKRTRSLPPEDRSGKASPPSESSSAASTSASTSASKATSTKKTSATQTPTFTVDFDPTRVRANAPPTPKVSQARPTVWDHASRPSAPYPGSPHAPSQGRGFYEQQRQRYYEQSQSAFPLPSHPPIRSFSAPLPQPLASTAVATGDSKDSDSSGSLVVEPSQHSGFSSRKVSKRLARPSAASDRFEAISQPEQPGGSGTMEPLPVQQEEERAADPMPALPNPPRERATRSSSRRSGRRASHGGGGGTSGGGAAESIHGLDWFQGELLLESDEDEEEEDGGEGGKDAYPV